MGSLEGGVVDEDIEAAELLYGQIHQLLAMRLVGDVAGHRTTRCPAFRISSAVDSASASSLKIGEDDIGAFTGKGDGDRPPMPSRRR